jgi:BlaI family transcriptional regulator, penicillinase repressor
MARKSSSQPTEVELGILNVLWEKRAATVREVHDQLQLQNRSTGYSTTLKMMQVMHQKGLLKRDDSVRPQVYRSTKSQVKTQTGLIDHLVKKAFDGAAGRLLVRAISSNQLSDDELSEIKSLIEKIEQEQS